MDNRPIGVFDSGLGGLTVVRKLMELLPGEDIVYFGDNGRVPYGTRSAKTIEKYAREDCKFLMSHDVKMIIAACGTVSSVAAHVLKEFDVPAFGVVSSAAREAARESENGRIGVIGTSATIKTDAFGKSVKQYRKDVKIFNQACPIFVSLVENGWISSDDKITNLTAERYLTSLKENEVDTIILGCTHFPIIKRNIGEVVGMQTKLIDTGKTTAKAAKKLLEEKNMLNLTKMLGRVRFFVSDQPEDFSKSASMFLGKEVNDDVEIIDIDLFEKERLER